MSVLLHENSRVRRKSVDFDKRFGKEAFEGVRKNHPQRKRTGIRITEKQFRSEHGDASVEEKKRQVGFLSRRRIIIGADAIPSPTDKRADEMCRNFRFFEGLNRDAVSIYGERHVGLFRRKFPVRGKIRRSERKSARLRRRAPEFGKSEFILLPRHRGTAGRDYPSAVRNIFPDPFRHPWGKTHRIRENHQRISVPRTVFRKNLKGMFEFGKHLSSPLYRGIADNPGGFPRGNDGNLRAVFRAERPAVILRHFPVNFTDALKYGRLPLSGRRQMSADVRAHSAGRAVEHVELKTRAAPESPEIAPVEKASGHVHYAFAGSGVPEIMGGDRQEGISPSGCRETFALDMADGITERFLESAIETHRRFGIALANQFRKKGAELHRGIEGEFFDVFRSGNIQPARLHFFNAIRTDAFLRMDAIDEKPGDNIFSEHLVHHGRQMFPPGGIHAELPAVWRDAADLGIHSAFRRNHHPVAMKAGLRVAQRPVEIGGETDSLFPAGSGQLSGKAMEPSLQMIALKRIAVQIRKRGSHIFLLLFIQTYKFIIARGGPVAFEREHAVDKISRTPDPSADFRIAELPESPFVLRVLHRLAHEDKPPFPDFRNGFERGGDRFKRERLRNRTGKIESALVRQPRTPEFLSVERTWRRYQGQCGIDRGIVEERNRERILFHRFPEERPRFGKHDRLAIREKIFREGDQRPARRGVPFHFKKVVERADIGRFEIAEIPAFHESIQPVFPDEVGLVEKVSDQREGADRSQLVGRSELKFRIHFDPAFPRRSERLKELFRGSGIGKGIFIDVGAVLPDAAALEIGHQGHVGRQCVEDFAAGRINVDRP